MIVWQTEGFLLLLQIKNNVEGEFPITIKSIKGKNYEKQNCTMV